MDKFEFMGSHRHKLRCGHQRQCRNLIRILWYIQTFCIRKHCRTLSFARIRFSIEREPCGTLTVPKFHNFIWNDARMQCIAHHRSAAAAVRSHMKKTNNSVGSSNKEGISAEPVRLLNLHLQIDTECTHARARLLRELSRVPLASHLPHPPL